METSTCLQTIQQTTNFTVQFLITSPWSMFNCTPECSKLLQQKLIANCGQGPEHQTYQCSHLSKSSLKEGIDRQQSLKVIQRFLFLFFDSHFVTSSINRKQCVGVIFGAVGTTYLHYSLVVSLSVYAFYSPCLSV